MITFRAASYGVRFGGPLATFVAVERGEGILVGGRALKAAEKAADYEETLSYDDDGAIECVTWGEHTYQAKDLFTAAELKEHRRALMDGEVICLYR